MTPAARQRGARRKSAFRKLQSVRERPLQLEDRKAPGRSGGKVGVRGTSLPLIRLQFRRLNLGGRPLSRALRPGAFSHLPVERSALLPIAIFGKQNFSRAPRCRAAGGVIELRLQLDHRWRTRIGRCRLFFFDLLL